MSLPAMSLLQKAWQQSMAIVNLTRVGFFVSDCVYLLIPQITPITLIPIHNKVTDG
jgi:hypothetical protein